ncbi:MAG: rhamnulokinase [Chloroflexota bacterium]
MKQYIAIDLGAESGRVIAGRLGEQLELQEIYRFANGPVNVLGGLHWDALHLFDEILRGLRKVAAEHGTGFAGLGVDTWGVDYALLDRDGALIGNPYCYRDSRTEGMMEAVAQRVPRQSVFERTGGIQFLTFNTLYQLYAMVQQASPQLDIAETFLMMPDLFNYWLTGEKVGEFTNATTTQFYNSLSHDWARDLLAELDIPTHILPDVVLPGTQIGVLQPQLDVGLGHLPVMTVASHDTASAAAAVPAAGDDVAWISSGTWSLVGAIAERPIVTPEALEYNISSYGGAGGACLPWTNVMGLWLVQECRRMWARQGEDLSYERLTGMAMAAQAFVAAVDPDDAAFLAPANMPQAIRNYCRDSGQPVPQTEGEIVRVALESLALKYRWVMEKLGLLLDRQFSAVHVVGGGSQNALLCQFTADATGLPVIAGPVEATAIGNIAVQAMGSGQLSTLDDVRQLVRRSFEMKIVEPGERTPWDEAYEGFLRLM